MGHRPRSLQHEYELYIECELEAYKESLPRAALLRIGDEAVAQFADREQLALTELLVREEVDRIIRTRLRLPSYPAWRRRRLKTLRELDQHTRAGRNAYGVLARAAPHSSGGHVLVAGASAEEPALYLAAIGYAVTAIGAPEEKVDRLVLGAAGVGLASRIRWLTVDLVSWTPDMPLDAVVCAAATLGDLSAGDRAAVIARLQRATTVGGLHLVPTTADGDSGVELGELTARYAGWSVSVERAERHAPMFLARKEVA